MLTPFNKTCFLTSFLNILSSQYSIPLPSCVAITVENFDLKANLYMLCTNLLLFTIVLKRANT